MPTIIVMQISLNDSKSFEFADFQLRFLAEHCPHLRACSLHRARIQTPGLRYTQTHNIPKKKPKPPQPLILCCWYSLTPLQMKGVFSSSSFCTERCWPTAPPWKPSDYISVRDCVPRTSSCSCLPQPTWVPSSNTWTFPVHL